MSSRRWSSLALGIRGLAGAVERALETDITPREVRVNVFVIARWEFRPAP